MRNRLFKLFLVFMLIVGIFVNNKAIINAHSANGKLPDLKIHNGNGYIEYEFNDDETELRQGKCSTQIPNLSVGTYFDEENNNHVIDISLSDDVTLSYNESTYSFFETAYSIKIHKAPNITKDVTLEFTGEYSTITPEHPANIIGIEGGNSVYIDGINIKFCAKELQGESTLKSDDDDFVFIYSENNVYVSNSNMDIYGSKIFEIHDGRSLYLNHVVMNANMLFGTYTSGKVTSHDYEQYDGFFAYANQLVIENQSKINININIPNLSPVQSNEGGTAKYVDLAPIMADYMIINNSSLTMKNNNYNQRYGIIVFTRLEALQRANINIDGFITSIKQGPIGGDKFYISNSVNAVTLPGIEFKNIDFNLISLLRNVELQQNVPFTILKDESDGVSDHNDIMKVIGTDADVKKLDLGLGFLVLSVVCDSPNQFGIKNTLKYKTLWSNDPTEDPSLWKTYTQEKVNEILPQCKAISIQPANKIVDPSLTASTYEFEATVFASELELEPITYDSFIVSFNKDTNMFEVSVEDDYTFERKTGDDYSSFIRVQNAGLKVIGDKTLTFKYQLEDGYDEFYGGNFKCFNIEEGNDSIISGTEDGKLKIVVQETTSQEIVLDKNVDNNADGIDAATKSYLFMSTYSEKSQGNSKLTISNVDINANMFGNIMSLGSFDTEINDSNIVYKYYLLNFEEKDEPMDMTCFETQGKLELNNTDLEIHGDESLKNTSGNIQVNGAIISQQDIEINDCDRIWIHDYLFGIGSLTKINIDNSNLDIEGHSGGVGAINQCIISLSSSDGYVSIKSNCEEEITCFDDLFDAKMPAAFAGDLQINPPDGKQVIAYTKNSTTPVVFNRGDQFQYRRITIQEENVPWPTPTHMVQVEAFTAPTENKPGSLPYYQDENGHYYEDPDGKLPIKQDIEEWKKNQSIPKLEPKYKGKLSLVTPKMEEGIVKLITIDTIVTPVDESNKYAIMMDVEHQGDKNIYLIIDGHKVPFVQEPGTDNICFILENDYLNDLLDKEHEYYVVTSNGSATSKFKIEYKKVDPPGPPNPGHDSGYKNPKTGIR